MTGYEISDLLASNRTLISETWNYFLTVHLAIFGIIYIASGRTGVTERIILVVAYLAFMVINYAGQVDNYGNYERLIEQIAGMPDSVDGAAQAKALVKLAPVWITDWLPEVYAAAAAVSSLILLLINRDRAA
ncbi:MAG: hypothetical protein AAF224_15020 [Pseudomonadota bacterium]